jgi:hypothetical protein
MKRKRLNQIAAKQKQVEKVVQEVSVPSGINFGISDCDLGASPQMSKGSLLKQAHQAHPPNIPLQSPLGGVQSRILNLSKATSGAGPN